MGSPLSKCRVLPLQTRAWLHFVVANFRAKRVQSSRQCLLVSRPQLFPPETCTPGSVACHSPSVKKGIIAPRSRGGRNRGGAWRPELLDAPGGRREAAGGRRGRGVGRS